MRVTMYIASSQEQPVEMTWYHCFNCKRVLFKVNSSNMLISNSYGASFKQLEPSSNYIEYVCHSCKTPYDILFT